MKEKLQELFKPDKLMALTKKEVLELIRNKYLVFLILIPPVVQLLILCAALDPRVNDLNLSVVDNSSTALSRSLITKLIDTTVFTEPNYLETREALLQSMKEGNSSTDVGIVISPDFAEKILEGKESKIEVLVDGSRAYTAGIAENYVERTVDNFKPEGRGIKVESSSVSTASIEKIEKLKELDRSNLEKLDRERIIPSVEMLYNPEQKGSWYFVPGVLGACLTLVATLVASAAVLKERESGTIEQLLMTPTTTWQLMVAKIMPLFAFLMLDVVVALGCSMAFFGMPVRGSILLLMGASAIYALTGIGIGILLGTLCTSHRQAQLASFFFNTPLILLSGSVVPFDTMPRALQTLAVFDPLRYYTTIVRSVILKGTGAEALSMEITSLFISFLVVMVISSLRFRKQLT